MRWLIGAGIALAGLFYWWWAKRRDRAEVANWRLEKVQLIVDEIVKAGEDPASALHGKCDFQTVWDYISGAAEYIGSDHGRKNGKILPDEEPYQTAQWYIDQMLKWRALAFMDACADQNIFRKKVEQIHKGKPGRFSASQINMLFKEEETIEERIRTTENAFWSLHLDADALGFRVWKSHTGYLLLQ